MCRRKPHEPKSSARSSQAHQEGNLPTHKYTHHGRSREPWGSNTASPAAEDTLATICLGDWPLQSSQLQPRPRSNLPKCPVLSRACLEALCSCQTWQSFPAWQEPLCLGVSENLGNSTQGQGGLPALEDGMTWWNKSCGHSPSQVQIPVTPLTGMNLGM